jgi:membrane protein implicated in regulation of membrane protease activity
MVVTPAPIGLLIVVLELVELAVFVMGLFAPSTVSLILMIVPLMIVIVLFVVVAGTLVFVGEQRNWRYRDRDQKGGAKQSRIQKTGHDVSPAHR